MIDFTPEFIEGYRKNITDKSLYLSTSGFSYIKFTDSQEIDIVLLFLAGKSIEQSIEEIKDKSGNMPFLKAFNVLYLLAEKGFIKNSNKFYELFGLEYSKKANEESKKQKLFSSFNLYKFSFELMFIPLLFFFAVIWFAIIKENINPLIFHNSYPAGMLVAVVTVFFGWLFKQIYIGLIIKDSGGEPILELSGIEYKECDFLGDKFLRKCSLLGIGLYLFYFVIIATEYFITKNEIFAIAVWWSAFLIIISLSPFMNSDAFRWFSSFRDKPLKSVKNYWEKHFFKKMINTEIDENEIFPLFFITYSILWVILIFYFLNLLLIQKWFAEIYKMVNFSNFNEIVYLFWGILLVAGLFTIFLGSFYFLIKGLKPENLSFELSDKTKIKKITVDTLKNLSFYHLFNDDILNEVLKIISLEYFPKGSVIIKEGSQGDKFYSVIKGEVEVLKDIDGKEKHVAVLGESASFGEVALIKDVLRTATIRSVKNSALAVIDKQDFINLIQLHPEKGEKILNKIYFEQTISKVPFFTNLTWQEKESFFKNGKIEKVAKGIGVVNEGDEGDELFVILSGSVSVIKAGDEVAVLKDGDFFGEIALLRGVKRTALIKTKEETTFFILNREQFFNVLKNNIKEGIKVDLIADKRLKK